MKTFLVSFENSFEERRLLGKATTWDEVNIIIQDFLIEHNYKSYYSRWWKEGEDLWFCDVGSHSEFFVVLECNDKEVAAQ